MPGRTKARERGLYPEPGEPAYTSPQVSVTINLPAELWLWLKPFVSHNSFTYCVEETIVTALRCMAGRDCSIGMNAETLIGLISRERGISAAEAVFGRDADPAEIEAANILLEAAQHAARGIPAAVEHGPSEGEHGALILKLWSAAVGRDIAPEIEAVRLARAEEEAARARELDAKPHDDSSNRQRSRTPPDDDIPF
jgi:hypothetical protein